MSEPVWQRFGDPDPRPGGIVALCDHASNHVPAEIELGVPPALLEAHIAWDIGAAGVVRQLAQRHGVPGHLAAVSRLVIDLHREEDHAKLIPEESDGHRIPGNVGADRQGRLARFHRPYHQALAAFLDAAQPRLILSIHSFTPQMQSRPEEERPWEVALLYNQDAAPAHHAIRLLEAEGLIVGDNQPYSGRDLNATMNRHAEAQGRRYLAIEIRNDQIATEAGQARWAALIANIAGQVADGLGA